MQTLIRGKFQSLVNPITFKNLKSMKTHLSIPKELLAQADLNNTLGGGMAEHTASAWQAKDGYRLMLKTPGVDIEKLHIEANNNRFTVYYLMNILEGEQQVPYYLVNLPLAPEVDIHRISAHLQGDNKVLIKAPFNDQALGEGREIEIEKY
jgi:HSP20 family molecular chaperone IbpA